MYYIGSHEVSETDDGLEKLVKELVEEGWTIELFEKEGVIEYWITELPTDEFKY